MPTRTWTWHPKVVNLFDIFCVLAGIEHDFSICSFEDDDIAGSGSSDQCTPNGAVNVQDVLAAVDAAGGMDRCCTPGPCCIDGECTDAERCPRTDALLECHGHLLLRVPARFRP